MNKYWEYFKYVMEHKKNVFLVCKRTRGMFLHGVFHDLSKFHPKEFKAYANYFYGELNIEGEKPWWVKRDFDDAWIHHYKNNKHHWNHWVGRDMPTKYIKQMICDWKAMGIKFKDTPQAFYIKNYDKMNLTWQTRMDVEWELGLNDSSIHNYGHTLQQFANLYDENTYNKYFDFIIYKYRVDSYKFIHGYRQYQFTQDYITEHRCYFRGYLGWVKDGVVTDVSTNNKLFDLDSYMGRNVGKVL